MLKKMMDQANVFFSGLGLNGDGDGDGDSDSDVSQPQATTVRGKSGDDDELEWYQAFSFLAWQAGAAPGAAGASTAAESAEMQACLLSTSTLQRLKKARLRLTKRREELEGFVEVVEIFAPSGMSLW